MAVNAYDVQVCLWKLLKSSSKICLTVSIEHPYALSSLLVMFFLYIYFPFFFRILMYSLPLVVCTSIILSFSFSLRNDKKYKENDKGEETEDKSKKPYNRVHSVRRRRAKELVIEEVRHNVEEKNAISSTCDIIDKTALKEESPKEIHEVEVKVFSSASDSIKQENDEGSNRIRRLGILKDEEEEEEDETNKVKQCFEDDHKNELDAERNQRLESLIARRRSRRMMSLQVRRQLLNMDRNNHSQIPSLVIPKINTKYSPTKMGTPFSPGPGSAPSVLIPMRNPFDLPYDPQEERPILTGDSFDQEFSPFREMVFCRHESFSLGPSLSGGLYRNRDETSLIPDFGSRQRGSSTTFQLSKLKNQSAGNEFSPIKEQEPYEPSESKSNTDSPDDDQIKEIIQVHENDAEHNDNDEAETGNEDESGQIPQSDFNSSSTSPSSSSSSTEDQPMFKIDREAILKSLSSMRRNTILELDNNEDGNLSYANSALENASRLKQQYYEGKPKHHGVSYSIASDMQVEVSEVSSPPSMIDENIPCDAETDKNISSDGDEDDQSLSNSSNEQPLTEKHCIESEESEEIIEVSTVEDEPNSSGEASVSQTGGDLNDDSPQEQSQSSISPKSVLLPIPSLPSFDPYIGEVATPGASHDFTNAIEETRDVSCSSGDGESPKEEEPIEPTNTSTVEDVDTEFVNDKLKAQENGEQSEEIVCNGNSELVRTHEEVEQPKEETSSRSCNNDEVFIKDSEATNSIDLSPHIDHPDNLIPSISAEEELSKYEEIGESKDDDSSKTSNHEDQTENSRLYDETIHSESTNTSTLETVDTKFVNDKQKAEENGEAFITNLEAANSTDHNQHIDHPFMYTKEQHCMQELPKDEEIKESQDDDSSKTINHEDQIENSTLYQEMRPTNTSTLEVVDTEENGEKSDGNGNLKSVRTDEEPKEEIGSRSCNYNDELFFKNLEAGNSTDHITQHVDHPDKLIPSMFTKEELSKYEEIGKSKDDNSTTKNHGENSTLYDEMRHDEKQTSTT